MAMPQKYGSNLNIRGGRSLFTNVIGTHIDLLNRHPSMAVCVTLEMTWSKVSSPLCLDTISLQVTNNTKQILIWPECSAREREMRCVSGIVDGTVLPETTGWQNTSSTTMSKRQRSLRYNPSRWWCAPSFSLSLSIFINKTGRFLFSLDTHHRSIAAAPQKCSYIPGPWQMIVMAFH